MPYYPEQMQTKVKTILTQVKKAIYPVISELTVTAWLTAEPVPFPQRMTGTKKKLVVGEHWGNPGDWAWFLFRGAIPAKATSATAADRKMVLLINVGGEACVFDETGCPVQGLTNSNSTFDRMLGDPAKRVVYLTGQVTIGQPVALWVLGETRDLFGKYRDSGRLLEASLAGCREDIRDLYYDLAFLNDLMQNLPDGARRDQILFHLYDAANQISVLTPEEVRKATEILTPVIQIRGGSPSPARGCGGTLPHSGGGALPHSSAGALTLSALGNSHIDLAWLWPLAETVHKGARTCATALTMMERYPAYIFGFSQPQLYQWLKAAYPDLYAKIKRRVREGRWETLGAMWVETDTNIPGGESLIRQILYGKRFFMREFDEEPLILWLPDSFGFSGALPQIAAKAGLEFFCTTKLSWNVFNQYPHQTFIWQGIDGSRLLTHFPPEGTYNSSAAPRAVIKAEKNYRDKGVSEGCLMLYGIGDGGGGPGEEHLEWLARETDCPGLAPVLLETALDFFRKIASQISSYHTWEGELYLERHQGVYTTGARSKRCNRKMELALRDLEFWAALAGIMTGEPYPARDIEQIWQEVLLYQFHDIMAGSAIHQVYRESLARYAVLEATVNGMQEQARLSLARSIDATGKMNPVLLFNSTSWPRREWLKINNQWYQVTVAPLGYQVFQAVRGADPRVDPPECSAGLTATTQRLEHDILRLEFAADGSLAGVYDKQTDRPALAPGSRGNRLAIYRDDGDAWDIPIGYADRAPDYFRLRSCEARVDGPRAELNQVYDYGHSTLEQIIRITRGSRRIDFITKVDWRERQKMLRAAFPVDVHHQDTVCDIQFGNIRRPNNRNTSWEMAKYEVCAHKWIDLSDGGYGVALLSDCKYGYRVFENILDINLLRSPVYPDPAADFGVHEFTYALYPHPGDHVTGGVVRAGYELNIPLQSLPLPIQSVRMPPGKLPECYSLMAVEAANIIVETVKKAEDDGDLIIRLYECGGQATKTKLKISAAESGVGALQFVDLMEKPYDPPRWIDNGELVFGPFEIHTLKVNAARARAAFSSLPREPS